MTLPINNLASTHFATVNQRLLTPEDRLRTETNAEVASLERMINEHARGDPFSQEIILWCRSYQEAIRVPNGELNRVNALFTEQLQRLLRSPFPLDYPFDREVFLGSDNHTYGKKALFVYLSINPPSEGELPRSPLAPQNDAPFSVERHLLAEAMVAWLEARLDDLPSSDELENRYRTLVAEGRLPELPSCRFSYSMQPPTAPRLNDRMGQLMARRQQQEIRQQLGALQLLRNLHRVDAEIRTEFNSIQNNTIEGMDQMTRRIENLNQQEQQHIAEAQHDIAVLNVEVAELQEDNAELAGRIARVQEEVQQQARDNRRAARMLDPVLREERQRGELARLVQQLQQLPNPWQERIATFRREMEEQFATNSARVDAVEQRADQQLQALQAGVLSCAVGEINNQISQIEARNVELRNRITQLSGDIHKAELANAQIELCANKVEKAIKERERSNTMGLVKTVVVIGACALASYGASLYVQGFALASTGGGFQATLVIPI